MLRQQQVFCLFETLRMQPADGNPEGLGLQPVKSCFKLTVSCSEVIVDYDLIEKVAVLALHHMGRFNHFVKIFFLVRSMQGIVSPWQHPISSFCAKCKATCLSHQETETVLLINKKTTEITITSDVRESILTSRLLNRQFFNLFPCSGIISHCMLITETFSVSITSGKRFWLSTVMTHLKFHYLSLILLLVCDTL